MNKREAAEIRRRLSPERCGVDCIKGVYVSEARQIISEFELPVATMPQDELERYLRLFKKVLTGAIGKNLINVEFSTKQVADGEEQKLLIAMRDGISGNDGAFRAFCEKIIPSVPGDEKCVVLVMHDSYDVRAKSKDDDSSEQFRYVLCAVCPVKEKDSGLCYESDAGRFRSKAAEMMICPAEYGFMFPRFDDRCSNIYGALYYSKDASGGNALTDALFKTELPMAAKEQRTAFSEILRGAVCDECSYDLVCAVRDHISDVIESYENDKFASDPPVITKSELCDLLRGCSVSEDHIEAFSGDFEENFGKGAELTPGNLMELKKLEFKNGSVVIKIDPERPDLVEVKKIDGVKYIVIRVEDGVECNGIDIKIK